jgi:hypothetical protein
MGDLEIAGRLLMGDRVCTLPVAKKRFWWIRDAQMVSSECSSAISAS